MNSLFGWAGGKRNLRKRIVEIMPKHERYVEVFCGAAWVLLEKEKVGFEVINDINNDLITFYRVIQDKTKCKELLNRLNKTLKSRYIYDEFKKNQDDEDFKDDIDKALKFYYILRLSFSGELSTGRFFTTPSDSRKLINYDTINDDFTKLHDRLKHVFIENKDYSYILKKYDKSNNVFYIDPPYLNTTRDFYCCKFTIDDYIKLEKILNKLKSKWILSCNDCKELRDIYSNYNISEAKVNYVLGKKSGSSELIITNFI